MNEKQSGFSMDRRSFLAGAGAATLSFTVMKPQQVRAYSANDKVKIGLIGCGGRGTWIANLFRNHGGYEFTAGADYFADRVNDFGGKFNIPEKRRFTGLNSYKRMLDTGVDAIAIQSPPYFHPEQAQAGVDAGVHVYVAKPIAVDVPGCKTIEQSGRKASANKQVFLIDFQTRADDLYIEALKRVHDGAIGEFAFGESTYHAGSPWSWQVPLLEKDPDNPEVQLRAWGMSRTLSGDIIVEQNIHTLDVASWIMGQPPVHAVGTGGHKVRTDKGTCWDHFACIFQYPNDVGITFSSRQFNGHGTQPEGIRNRMFGSKGVLETEYGGQVLIRGENFYRGGKTQGIYQAGAERNIADFHKAIAGSDYSNPTVEPSVRSNLVCILGRTAAYEQRMVTWPEVLQSTERYEPNLKGLKD